MMYNAKEVTLNIQGVLFDYITFGSGKKTLIMIQGLNTRGIKGSATSLAYMYRMFAKDYKVYLFDRRPIVRDDITVRDMALDIAAAMDVLGIKNADVFGVSQGGMIAQYLAIDRPELVNKLVLAVTLSRNNVFECLCQTVSSVYAVADDHAKAKRCTAVYYSCESLPYLQYIRNIG